NKKAPAGLLKIRILYSTGKGECDRGPFPYLTVYVDLTLMGLHQMFNDRQSQTRSSGLPGTRFVHPIKTLKDTGYIFFRDSDSRIRHPDPPMIFFFAGGYDHLPAPGRIGHGVGQEID